MARIRSIKPTFFSSLTVADLTPEERLTFIGLWCFSDDEGRSEYDPRLLKAFAWPLADKMTAIVVEKHVAKLAEMGLVERYESAGRSYLQVVGWKEHQSISHPRKSTYPAPAALPEDSGNVPGSLPEASGPYRKGKEGRGKEGSGDAASAAGGGWVAEAVTRWAAVIGIEKHGRMGKELAPAVAIYGAPAVLAAITKFGEWRRDRMADFGERVPGLPYFVSNIRAHIPRNLLPSEATDAA